MFESLVKVDDAAETYQERQFMTESLVRVGDAAEIFQERQFVFCSLHSEQLVRESRAASRTAG